MVCLLIQRERIVSYDGSNVDFDNPMYKTMDDERIDTTPAAFDDSDKKYMPDVGEVSSQDPFTTD